MDSETPARRFRLLDGLGPESAPSMDSETPAGRFRHSLTRISSGQLGGGF